MGKTDNMNTKLLYKSSEVANMLGITTATLKKLVNDNKIEAVVIRTHRYFTQEAIKKFLAESVAASNKPSDK
jgi:excisionase family DNA binding protein